MAFNFNWSPLIADTSRARDMLTIALNRSPKPPIIVDDILVTELNLGQVPPELEILEIGDLAEDRFRGIFKMSYTGDAFLTLKTRVQANPLNTYLSTKPSFASPQPLAAASGLTIPLQITLSDIKLSGFVILVFSKQKGLTLVFRNDPLESLKVSSTFDSIPFVRDYLQKEIEGQLRVLFMEDLPAILHRLSLRLWSPDYSELDDETMVDSAKAMDDGTVPIDPLASPPQDAVDAFGNPLEDGQISSFNLDSSSEMHATFSQKNLLRLAALTDSHRTLSLFTPSIRDAVFRAWAGASERGESGTHTPSLTLSSLTRVNSSLGSRSASSTYSFSGSTESGSVSSRPSLTSLPSTYGLSTGAGRSRAHAGRKRKNRVVNLRRDKDHSDTASVATETETPPPSVAPSEASYPASQEREGELTTPPRSPNNKVRFRARGDSVDNTSLPPYHSTTTQASLPSHVQEKARAASPPVYQPAQSTTVKPTVSEKPHRPAPPAKHASHHPQRPSMNLPLLRTYSLEKLAPHSMVTPVESSSGGILEQAWMHKMAAEIARKVAEEKARQGLAPGQGFGQGMGQGVSQGKSEGFWSEGTREREETPPPAYAA